MAKTKISEYSATSANNTDISNINIAEGCSPANVNNAIRTLMAQIKDLQAGTSGDTIPVTAGGTGSATATDARTSLSAAKSGANSDITSLTACTSITGLTTPLTTAQGGTGTASTTFANLATNVTGTLPVSNGGTGSTTLTANSVILGNGTSALSGNLVAPTTAGNVLFTTNGTSWSSTDKITSATAQNTTSGTTKDFTNIPSWVKRITIMINGVSTNGTSFYQIQLGDAGGIETTSYLGGILTNTTFTAYNSGFIFNNNVDSSYDYYGAITLTKCNGNTWIATTACNSNALYGNGAGSGAKTLSDTLDRVRITTANGTDTFDAGSINILYE